MKRGIRMLEIQQALRIVKEVAERFCPIPVCIESVPILDSIGRVLAENITLDFPHPPFDRSMRDGYALRAVDSIHAPVILPLVGESAAGHPFCGTLQAGEALAIMTGAPVPPGADSVAMFEDVGLEGEGRIRISKPVRPGLNVAKIGSERQSGETVLHKGTILGGAELAILAVVGKSAVRVFSRPRVAILVTGDELAGMDQEPGRAEIRDSNSYMLWGQIISAGGLPVRLGIAKDQPDELRNCLEEGLGFDVLVVSGGVSKGKYDLVKPLLLELGAVLHFESLKLKPGKPAVFATAKGKYIFGLPGNPVSAFVTFELLARPLLRLL
jgi:molybdopterin molybdotransferase